jgi:hypothetical protein
MPQEQTMILDSHICFFNSDLANRVQQAHHRQITELANISQQQKAAHTPINTLQQ